MTELGKESISGAVLSGINETLGKPPYSYPPIGPDDGWQDTNQAKNIPPKVRKACTESITSRLRSLGIPATVLDWISEDGIAFPQTGPTVRDLVDFCFRSVVSAAVRRGVQEGLGLDEVPAETYSWQTPRSGPSVDVPARQACIRPIRAELQKAQFSNRQTDLLKTTSIANPGADPGDLTNLVDYCSDVLSSPPPAA